MQRPKLRRTQAVQMVLRVLLDHLDDDELYGLRICAEAGLPSGTIHPMLARLKKLGLVEARREDVDPSVVGRPARHYYRLTPDGVQEARAALTRIQPAAPLHPRTAQ
ncbi:PadR family transcriptional regulator [Cryptosporangium aurantiacum]|uniref:PadR family transcriptional regulator n=1 Tax=Cryptosporangium aurantiacum TaxID=134849 RepID=UPI000932BB15|nr:PadR family transcriptional regulator [Cryptosporangium aurantiacum]